MRLYGWYLIGTAARARKLWRITPGAMMILTRMQSTCLKVSILIYFIYFNISWVLAECLQKVSNRISCKMIYSYFIKDDLDLLTREEYESALVSAAPNIAPEEKDAMPTTVSKWFHY